MFCGIFNLFEGIWWVGLGLGVMSFRSVSNYYKSGLAIILVLFGISDFVEMVTGTWWQPWWLLAWKAVCIAVGTILFITIFNEGKSR